MQWPLHLSAPFYILNRAILVGQKSHSEDFCPEVSLRSRRLQLTQQRGARLWNRDSRMMTVPSITIAVLNEVVGVSFKFAWEESLTSKDEMVH
jgi:hypothetical protein